MVGSQIKTKQWKVFSMETPSIDNKIRCIKGSLGAYHQGKRQVTLVQEKTSHQCTGPKGSKIRNSSL